MLEFAARFLADPISLLCNVESNILALDEPEDIEYERNLLNLRDGEESRESDYMAY